jgi:hypothetical protein
MARKTPNKAASSKRQAAASALEVAERKSWSSTKFDILNCITVDPRVTHRNVRIATRILKQVDEKTGIAYISDETLCDEIPKLDRWQMNDFRKQMAAIRWLSFERNHRQHATTYRFLTANINPILDVIISKRETRAEKRLEQKAERAAAARKVTHPDVVAQPHRCASDVVAGPHADVVAQPPLHLRGSPTTFIASKGSTFEEEVQALKRDAVLHEALTSIGNGDVTAGSQVAAEMGPSFGHVMDRIRSLGGADEDWDSLHNLAAAARERLARRGTDAAFSEGVNPE